MGTSRRSFLASLAALAGAGVVGGLSGLAKVVRRVPVPPALPVGTSGAITIPFATLPTNMYIRGPRYKVVFDRIVTPRFTRDADEIRAWQRPLLGDDCADTTST